MIKLFDIDYTCGECLVKASCTERCDTWKRDLEKARDEFEHHQPREMINHILTKQNCPLCNNDICQVDKDYASLDDETQRVQLTLNIMCDTCHEVLSVDIYYIDYEDYIDVTNYNYNNNSKYIKINYKELVNLLSIFNIDLLTKYIKEEFSEEFMKGFNSNRANIA